MGVAHLYTTSYEWYVYSCNEGLPYEGKALVRIKLIKADGATREASEGKMRSILTGDILYEVTICGLVKE